MASLSIHSHAHEPHCAMARVKAVVFDRYGAADVLRAIDLPMPQAGPGEIRVRVRAAGVRPGDIALRSGAKARDRRETFPRRLGNEFAGIVDQVGAGVGEFQPGDEVMGWAEAMSYAEVLTVPAGQAVRKPATMSWAVAGALPSTGQTAYIALRQLRVGAGDTVLIHGAASAIGGVAVQLARIWGAHPIASAAAADHDYLRSLGAQPVLDDTSGMQHVRALAPGGVDAMFDARGDEAFAAWIGLSGDAARIASLSDRDPARRGDPCVLGSRACLAELAAMHERHGLLVQVREMFPLTHAAEAHRAVERGPARGKVVLMVYEAVSRATACLYA